MNEFLKQFVNILIPILYWAIIARVIVSWLLPPRFANNPIVVIIYQITEPILAPLRRLPLRIGMIDLSPMVAIILLGLVQTFVNRYL